MTTVHIPISTELDLDGDGKITLVELITASGYIARWIIIPANAINFAVMLAAYVFSPWQAWLWAFREMVLVFSLSIVVGYAWSAKIAIDRGKLPDWAHKESKADIEMRREREGFELRQIMGISEKEGNTRWTQDTQDKFARLFLNLSYEKGSFITRNEWVARGLPEDSWNRINDLLKKHKIRNGRSSELQHDTSAGAWGAWCDAMMKSRQWVKSGSDLIKD